MPVAVHEVVERAAGLDAFAAVGAPPVDVLGQAALAAVAHAERSVHEALYLAGDGGADLADLREREFTLQDDALAAQRLEEPGARHVADGALGGGVDGNGDVVPRGDPGLADDEGVRPGLLGAEQLRMRLLFLPVTPQSVECHENPHPETMGVGAEFSNIFEAVARRLAGAEIGTRDIYGIGTAVNGCDADFFVPGGGQQLERLHYFRASSIFLASAPYLGSLAALV